MSETLVFGNAMVVLADEVVHGWVAVRDGLVLEVGRGTSPHKGYDLGGEYLMPGLVELHTDHLEHHLKPRPKVSWPEASAIIAFDAQIAASGITTVFDCIRAGADLDYAPMQAEVARVVQGIEDARAKGMLRVDHRLHVRCEVCADDVLEQTEGLTRDFDIALISLMDHTPGARQFTSLEAWRTYYGGKTGLAADQLDLLIERKHETFARNYDRHRRALVALARQNGIVLASHDDATTGHVSESISDDVAIAEFPTTREAAALSHGAGIRVMMGAPNVVRGGSHSGNVAAEDLARDGVLDILSSDYVPSSLLLGAFGLASRIEGLDLASAVRKVSLNPAQAAGLDDRGEIAAGKRADLLWVADIEGLPVVREVYRAGKRIF